MLAELDDYDWEQAFSFGGGRVMLAMGSSVEAAPFTREDVVEIIGITAGENDGEPWEIAGRLADGRWFFLSAWCDYTGWDGHAGGQAWVADDRDTLVQFGIPCSARDRWGLV